MRVAIVHFAIEATPPRSGLVCLPKCQEPRSRNALLPRRLRCGCSVQMTASLTIVPGRAKTVTEEHTMSPFCCCTSLHFTLLQLMLRSGHAASGSRDSRLAISIGREHHESAPNDKVKHHSLVMGFHWSIDLILHYASMMNTMI
jgi:hypothetical protein